MRARLSRLRRAGMMASLSVMLTACAASLNETEPAAAPDPVIIRERVEVRVCPAELMAEVPDQPAVPDGAVLKGNESGLGFLGELINYAALLAARLRDAAGECDQPVSGVNE